VDFINIAIKTRIQYRLGYYMPSYVWLAIRSNIRLASYSVLCCCQALSTFVHISSDV